MNLDVSAAMPISTATRSRLTLRSVVAIVITVAVAGVALFVRSLMNAPAPRPQAIVHSITLLPPPPPPKLEEKPPEPEVKEPVKLPEPEPTPQEANDEPPAGDLGVDAEGSGSGDGFKLQGRKGGRSLLAAGSPFSSYGSTVQDRLYERLSRRKDIRNANYAVKIKLWFAKDGTLARFELVDTTGNAELDRSIKTALADVGRLPAPPEEMPQPMVLRFTGRK